MKKIDNKGFTLVELIISFALLMVLVIGMLNIINSIRANANEKAIDKKIVEYKTTIVSAIQNKFIKTGYKSSTDCTTQYVICRNVIFKDNTNTDIKVNLIDKNITFDGITYDFPHRDQFKYLNNTSYLDIPSDGLVSISIDSNNYLIINVPYFKNVDVDNNYSKIVNNLQNYNYGFKIVFPINL